MAISILDATDYISQFCLDVDEWMFLEDEQKQRFLNVANRTLIQEFEGLVIPDSAVYEFSNVLSIAFSDVNKLQTHGIENLTIVGLGTFEFREHMVKHPSELNIANLIPPISREIIQKENGIKISNRKLKWTGM